MKHTQVCVNIQSKHIVFINFSLNRLSACVNSSDEGALEKIEKEDKMEAHKACWELEFLPIAQELMKALDPTGGRTF